jgi:hypothetical protein
MKNSVVRMTRTMLVGVDVDVSEKSLRERVTPPLSPELHRH